MKNTSDRRLGGHLADAPGPRSWAGWQRPAAGHWITASELQALRTCLHHGRAPLDLQVKLAMLAGDDLRHHGLAQHSRLFLELLLAVAEGTFRHGTPDEHELLLRALAYVRKPDDAIPDHRSDGYVDDQREVRAVALELAPLLHQFKLWRLRDQVPRLWRNHSSGAGPK